MNAAIMKQLEKSFKSTVDSNLQQNICRYLCGLRKNKFYKLLDQSTPEYSTEDRNIIIGELRVIQKLLDVLEPKAGLLTFEDNRQEIF